MRIRSFDIARIDVADPVNRYHLALPAGRLQPDDRHHLRWSPSAPTLAAFSPFTGLRHERFIRAEQLARTGRLEAAVGWLSTYAEHSAYGRVYLAPSLYRRGEILEQMGKRGEAAAAYYRFIQLWRNADPEFQPMVAEARRRAARLREPS